MIKSNFFKNKQSLLAVLAAVWLVYGIVKLPVGGANATMQLSQGFVYLSDIDPTILQDVRYAGTNNFVGRPVNGYEKATVILTKEAAEALATVQKTLLSKSNGNFTLMVYDGYRPQRAVNNFWNWSKDLNDQAMKATYYPNIADKQELFEKGYIAEKSGHSRGSTVDLTIATIDGDKVAPLDMGAIFDFFDTVSHYVSDKITPEAQKNRAYLRNLMIDGGFVPYENEWWHFTLKHEPFPATYFDFPVR